MKTLRLCIVSILILTLFLAEGEVFAQAVPQYQLSIQNRTMIGTTYQFDIFIKRVGSTNFRLGNSQFILCTLFWPRRGCNPVPGRPIWPLIMHSAIRQRALSVPWMCCDMPIPHKIIEAFDFA